MFSAHALQSTVETNKGVLELVLDGQKVELRQGFHFYLRLLMPWYEKVNNWAL